MSLSATRINLLPTTRTLASGVPYAPKLAFHMPPQRHSDEDHHGFGPRSEVPPTWVFKTNARLNSTKINCESRFHSDTTIAYGQQDEIANIV